MHQFEQFLDPWLDHVGQCAPRQLARRSVIDPGDLQHLLGIGQFGEGTAVAPLDVLGGARRRTQCHGDVVGDLVTGYRHHRGMADRALRPHRQIGRSATDIDQADTEFLFVIRKDGIARRQRLQHQIIDFQPAAAHTFDDVLRGRYRAGDDMHLHFKAETAHADRFADAVLVVDGKLLRQDVQDFLIGRNRHCPRGFDDAVDVHRCHFLVLDCHHAVRIEAADVAAGDTGVDVTNLAVGHQFDLLQHPRDRRHRILDVDHHAFFQSA